MGKNTKLPWQGVTNSGRLFVGFHMEAVEDAVDQGRQQHADIGDEDHPAKKCIDRGKELGAIRCHLHHRAHTPQQHAGIVQGVDPTAVVQAMKADHADAQRNHQDGSADEEVIAHPLHEFAAADKRLFPVLVHIVLFY